MGGSGIIPMRKEVLVTKLDDAEVSEDPDDSSGSWLQIRFVYL